MDKLILTKIVRICTIFILLILAYFILRYTFSFVLPFIAVFVIANIMEPAVRSLQSILKVPRGLASITVLFLFLSICIGTLFLIVTEIYEGITYLAAILPEQLRQFGSMIETLFQTTILPIYDQAYSFINKLSASDNILIEESISELFQHIGMILSTFFQQILFTIPANLSMIPESLAVIFFILFASFLLSADYPRVKHFLLASLPGKVKNKIHHIYYSIQQSIFGYLKAQFILIALSFHLIFLGLFIIGVEHALTIALFMIFLDLIPFLGTGLLFIPWIGYSFLSGNYPLTIGLSITYGIVIITRQLMEPKVYSVNMAVHPLVWLMAAFIGIKVWGVLGLFLAPLGIVLCKGLYDAGVIHWMKNYINGNT